MAAIDPVPYLWWLTARAAGLLALGLVSLAVVIGLLMSTKTVRRPGAKKTLVRLHEHLAIAGLLTITLHGLSLLGDRWLHPGLSQLAIPFTLSYRPLFTGLGVVGGYLAALFTLSFYVRRRIGTRLWRRLHRATVLVWVIGVIHALGAGSDASTTWMRAFLLITGIPILYLTVLRILQSIAGRRSRGAVQPAASPRRASRGATASRSSASATGTQVIRDAQTLSPAINPGSPRSAAATPRSASART